MIAAFAFALQIRLDAGIGLSGVVPPAEPSGNGRRFKRGGKPGRHLGNVLRVIVEGLRLASTLGGGVRNKVVQGIEHPAGSRRYDSAS